MSARRLACAVFVMTVWTGRATPVAAQPACAPPKLMWVVDCSSSMREPADDGASKWDETRQVVEELLEAYDGRIAFGLTLFPVPDRCEVASPLVPIGAASTDAIIEAMSEPPPESGNFTPMAEALELLASESAFTGTDGARHVVLITDGWQWCSPHDPSTRFAPVAGASELAALGVSVHVVGFGRGVDALTLNRLAVAGTTAPDGCDAESADPVAEAPCYGRANDLAALREVLDAIALRVIEEVCDGRDNDCDGTVDEGFDADGDAVTTCATPRDCDDARADVAPGLPELCDGVDNDCDGRVDVGCECRAADTVECGLSVGLCRPGVQRCEDGGWGACEGATEPRPESCDGKDEDCDGRVDNDAGCASGAACQRGACVILPPAAGAGCACELATRRLPSHRAFLVLCGLCGVLARARRRRPTPDARP